MALSIMGEALPLPKNEVEHLVSTKSTTFTGSQQKRYKKDISSEQHSQTTAAYIQSETWDNQKINKIRALGKVKERKDQAPKPTTKMHRHH